MKKQQRGGTLIGFVLGALVGLGAALAVAVYITKVPIPFLSRGAGHSTDSDADEAKKNRDWDPNAALGSKPRTLPALPPVPEATNKPAGAPTASASAPKAAKAPTPPATQAPTDPLGDLARSKTDPASGIPAIAAAGGSADPFSYFVQAGAFRTPEDAEQQRAKISLMGLQARVTEREQSGRMVYRVRLGPFDKKVDAEKAKERLDGNGVGTALVRVQK